jgi:hypothetical protein
MLAGTPLGGYFYKSVKVFAFEAENADAIDVAEFALAHGQSGRGNLDGIVGGSLASAKGFEEVASLSAAAAAEFGYGNRGRQPFDDAMAMPPQQAFIGASKPVLREMADHFE